MSNAKGYPQQVSQNQRTFEIYLQAKGLAASSVKHYVGGVTAISRMLQNREFAAWDVFAIDSLDALLELQDFLDRDVDFQRKNSVGHNMYSVAFRQYMQFVQTPEPVATQCFDRPHPRPDSQTLQVERFERNAGYKELVLIEAGFHCTCNRSHTSFLAQSNHLPYMEAHHLIPLQFQPQFEYSLDVCANMVSLCPTCHRLLHYAEDPVRHRVIEALFESRQERLQQCGIALGATDLWDLYRSGA